MLYECTVSNVYNDYGNVCLFQDVAIAVMISTSLSDLTKNNFIGNLDLVFETSLLFVFIIAIVLVQVSFCLLVKALHLF
jgi:hypothetical protein